MCYIRTADEEDELLYGETESNVFNSSFNIGQTSEMERWAIYLTQNLVIRNEA